LAMAVSEALLGDAVGDAAESVWWVTACELDIADIPELDRADFAPGPDADSDEPSTKRPSIAGWKCGFGRHMARCILIGF